MMALPVSHCPSVLSNAKCGEHLQLQCSIFLRWSTLKHVHYVPIVGDFPHVTFSYLYLRDG